MLNTAMDRQQTQQLQALRQANRVRLARAELKRRVAAGTASAAAVILGCPWEAASMEVGELLRSQRRWGAARCRRLLLSVGLTENKQLDTLTDRQREALAAVLEAPPSGRSGYPRRATVSPPASTASRPREDRTAPLSEAAAGPASLEAHATPLRQPDRRQSSSAVSWPEHDRTGSGG